MTNDRAAFLFLLRNAEILRDSPSWLQRRAFYPPVRLAFWLWSMLCGFDIPLGVFGAGLSIAHRGSIVVNGDAVVGRNCRIHQNVTIGAIGGEAPVIGDDVFIGPGAGIYGPVRIGSGAKIGPHAYVVDDVPEAGRAFAPKATIR
ncbi:serine acetyltransferase [Nocardioides zeae]|uniref:Serine acetyltransferase n=1 Tax=Nocardioides zeae TaxID=1457234 RepID=A0ACC6IKI2_9ACTN|nr:hypothetical protein [Nocardioides zeae]MDR6173592.1 serine acetyltransferase [Nocardioides zeae]MDR6210997.1 serine acetyltransferase [Nocardioides zeae]